MGDVLILLDTCVLIDFDKVALDPREGYSASMISRAELEFGIHRAPDAITTAERIQRLAAFDGLFDWWTFNLADSRAYGEIASNARPNTGAYVRSKDSLIAAQAYARGAVLMTSNTADFLRFAHLIPVISPTWKTAQ